MLLEMWPQFPRFVQNKGEHRKLPRLKVNRQLEAIRKQSLHHESKLVLRRIAGCVRLDVISKGIRQFRKLGLEGLTLLTCKLVCKHRVLKQREVHCGKEASRRSEKTLRIQGNVRCGPGARLVRLDRRNVERHLAASIFLPLGYRRRGDRRLSPWPWRGQRTCDNRHGQSRGPNGRQE